MSKDSNVLSEFALFLAGVLAAGLLSGRRREEAAAPAPAPARPASDSATVLELRRAVAEMEQRITAQEATTTERFGRLESRLDETTAKLADVPSTKQIVGAMEQLLAKTLSSLDERMSSQTHSIDVLKTTVAQTDSLLERVLESLDSLQSYADPLEDPLLQREAV